MNLAYAQGTLTWNGADAVNTTYTVSGLAFQPKALRFSCNGQDATGTNQTSDMNWSMGFATSPSNRAAVCALDDDGPTTTFCGSGYNEAAVLMRIEASGGNDGLLDLNAVNADGFQLIVDDKPASSTLVFWEAWGGSDITVATVGLAPEPAATGNVDYTVTGFVAAATDQCVMFAGVQTSSASPIFEQLDSGRCVGFATSGSSANNVVALGNSDDNSATADTDGYALAGECLAMIVRGGGNPDARATLTQFGTDNFRLNWIARAVTNRRNIWLAIKGGNWSAGSYTINNTTIGNTAVVSGLSFQPIGGCAIGRASATQSAGTSATEDRLAHGSWTATDAMQSVGVWSENGTGNAEVNVTAQTDTLLVFPTAAGIVKSAYGLNSVAADGFTIEVDFADATPISNEWQGYLTFGSAPASFAPWIQNES